MTRVPLRAFLVSVALISFPFQVHAQVSFLQPPSYKGGGIPGEAAVNFVADFNNDGKLDLLTPDGFMNLGNGDGTFILGTQVPVPNGSLVLAVADFNGDSKLDVLEQDTSKGTLLVLLGNGDGTFQAAISTPIDAILSPINAVDLNGDGKADVVGLFNSSFVVCISNGDGTFKASVSYNMGVTSSSLTPLSLGDFNGDLKIDVVVSFLGDNAPGEEITFFGNGDGTFQSTPKISPGLANLSSGSTVGDFNGDGKLDLAIVSPGSCNGGCGPSEMFLFPGNGDGSFQAPTALLPMYELSVITAADLNGDGRLDLVVEQDPTVVQIYLQNVDGTFSNAYNYVMTMPSAYYGSAFSTGIAVADFNHDGKLDIAAENGVLLGNGNGSFRGIPLGSIPASSPTAALVGDFENKRRMDAAVVFERSLYILQNDGQGNLSLIQTYTLQQSGQGIVTADFNGDGKLDLVVFGTDSTDQSWNYSVLLGKGDGSFQAPVYYPQSVPAGTYYGLFVVADFNNDHKPDIALVTGNPTQPITILMGNGDGTFAAPAYYFDGSAANWFVIADFNTDGNMDIAVSSSSGEGILYGNGDGTFQPIVFPASLNAFGARFTADVNNDGKADLIGRQIALVNGDGTFTVLPSLLPNDVSGIADFNGDGTLDLFVTTTSNGHPQSTGIQLANGNGTFGPFIQVPTNGMLWSTFFADMNGDGQTDIVFLWDLAGSEPFKVGGLGVLFNTVVPAAPDFSLNPSSGSPTSHTVAAGQSATFSLDLAPSGAFNGTVAFTCAISPSVTPAPTCSVPASVQITASGTQSIKVSVGTTASVTSGAWFHLGLPSATSPLIGAFVFLGLALLWIQDRKRITSAAMTLLILAMIPLSACGGSGSSSHTTSGTPAGTYNVTVTATAGNLNHQVVFQLLVH